MFSYVNIKNYAAVIRNYFVDILVKYFTKTRIQHKVVKVVKSKIKNHNPLTIVE